MSKKIILAGALILLFLSSGCLNRLKGLLGSKETKVGENITTLKGSYGVRVTEWKALGDNFVSGEKISFVVGGKDSKDGVAPKNVYVTLLEPKIKNKLIGDIKDGGKLALPQINTRAPEVGSDTTFSPYLRLCYVYNTTASQQFWVARAEDYPEELEEPNISSSINEGPINLMMNPSSPFPEIEVRPIRISERPTNKTFGIKLLNRGEGFVTNGTTAQPQDGKFSFGRESTIQHLWVEVPAWQGNITFQGSNDLNCSKEEDTWYCEVSNLMLTRGGRTVGAAFQYNLPEGTREKVGRIWATARYRYCILTDPIDIAVRKQY